MPQTIADPTALLRDYGLRVTAARLAVLSAVASQPHAPADEIATAARERLGALSTAAVYEVLNAFTEVGLVRRIEPAGSPARYETRTADNHHHAVCRLCGSVSDIDCAVGAAPCLEPSNANGFVIERAEVTWWGICAACTTVRATTTALAPDYRP
ncbi:MAG TPA: Fur family transcriptional regulator [Acidothermaceae bacterium]|nr:Fur family transcriptional regulator [Acidothermaceae bacterium]